MATVGKNVEMKRALYADIKIAFGLMLKTLNKKHAKLGPAYIRNKMIEWLVQHNSDRTRRTMTQREQRKYIATKVQRELEELKKSLQTKTYLDDLNKEDNSDGY